VNTDRAAAVRAGPSDFFVCHKLPNPKPANIFQILDHAHRVFGSISFIQVPYTLTGELLALKTKSRFGVLKEFAAFDLAPGTRYGVINISFSAAGAFVSCSQMSYTNPTVHSAWGDEGDLR
jgi:hypothetical protein